MTYKTLAKYSGSQLKTQSRTFCLAKYQPALQIKHPKAKLEISHHACSDGGDFTCSKPLVFVMDEVKEETVKKEGKKKKKTPGLTNKNFGAHLQVSKVKSSEMLALAWRCRFLAVWA